MTAQTNSGWADLPVTRISDKTLALTIRPVTLKSDIKDRDPKVRWKPEPGYTKQALKLRVCGLLGLAFDINETGRTANIRVIASIEDSLDRNAVETVKGWIFWPAVKDGVPVKMENAIVDFTFPCR